MKLGSVPQARKRILLILDFNDDRVDGIELYESYQKEWELVIIEAQKDRRLAVLSGVTVLYFHSTTDEHDRIVLPTTTLYKRKKL